MRRTPCGCFFEPLHLKPYISKSILRGRSTSGSEGKEKLSGSVNHLWELISSTTF